MLVLGINKILNWCQITSGGRKYTCPTKLIGGQLFFVFKKNGIVWQSMSLNMRRNLFQKAVRFSRSHL